MNEITVEESSQPHSKALTPALVQRTVDEICASAPFRASRQCQDLLRYVVTHSLAGQDQELKERIIGAEVFKRSPDYDPGEDPVVRNRAAEVRKRLAQYYHAANGAAEVHIDIPSGSYKATFEWLSAHTPATLPSLQIDKPPAVTVEIALLESPVAQTAAHQQAESHRGSSRLPVRLELPRHWTIGKRNRWTLIAAPLLLGAICAAAFLWKAESSSESDFKRFWSPLVESPKPVVLCLGSNAVYRLSDKYMTDYLQQHPVQNPGVEFYVNWQPGQQIDTHDLLRAWNSFVALGDVAAVSEAVSALSRQGKSFTERYPPEVSFAELQNTPAVMVGGFNNWMALTLTKDLRYQLRRGNHVEDQQNKAISWTIRALGDSHDTEDYAIVSRLVNAKTGGPVLCISGLGQYGTQAAGTFINSPKMISELAKTAPKDWYKKNFQAVLHVKVIDYRPISTEVVATDFW